MTKKFALLAGIGKSILRSHLSELPAREDLQQMETRLRTLGFEMHRLQDEEVTAKALEAACEKARQASVFIFYFTGHGATEQDRELLHLWDGDATLAEVQDWMVGAEPRRALLIVDACRRLRREPATLKMARSAQLPGSSHSFQGQALHSSVHFSRLYGCSYGQACKATHISAFTEALTDEMERWRHEPRINLPDVVSRLAVSLQTFGQTPSLEPAQTHPILDLGSTPPVKPPDARHIRGFAHTLGVTAEDTLVAITSQSIHFLSSTWPRELQLPSPFGLAAISNHGAGQVAVLGPAPGHGLQCTVCSLAGVQPTEIPIPAQHVLHIAFQEDQLRWFGLAGGSLKTNLDAKYGTPTLAELGMDRRIACAASSLSRAGSVIVFGGQRGQLAVWEWPSRHATLAPSEPGPVSACAVSPDRKLVAAAWMRDLRVYQTSRLQGQSAARKCLFEWRADTPVSRLCFSPSGRLGVGCAGGKAYVWDPRHPNEIPLVVLGKPNTVVSSLAFSPDEEWLFVACTDDWVQAAPLRIPSVI